MNDEYDAIVLGLGGIGSGAAFWLAERGARVLGIEQFELGHARGESHDHSRIIRLSYVAPNYVQLAKEAYDAWSAVEADSGERLVFRTGGFDIGPRDGAIPIQGYADALSAAGVPYEILDAAEIRRRVPAWQVDDSIHALFQADGGIVAAERATAAHQRIARSRGAVLLEKTPVTAIEASNGAVNVEAGGRRYHARHLIVAAGPWSGPVLQRFGVRLPLEVTKEQAMYFAQADTTAFAFREFPVWIWMDDPSFYGFPAYGDGVKVAQDAGGRSVDPDTRTFEPDPEALARVLAFTERTLPGAFGAPSLVKTCLYTLTPDRDFVIDTLPGHPNVSIAIGAGHAFKYASVIGRILAELARDGTSVADISPFSLGRPILAQASPERRYLV